MNTTINTLRELKEWGALHIDNLAKNTFNELEGNGTDAECFAWEQAVCNANSELEHPINGIPLEDFELVNLGFTFPYDDEIAYEDIYRGWESVVNILDNYLSLCASE